MLLQGLLIGTILGVIWQIIKAIRKSVQKKVATFEDHEKWEKQNDALNSAFDLFGAIWGLIKSLFWLNLFAILTGPFFLGFLALAQRDIMLFFWWPVILYLSISLWRTISISIQSSGVAFNAENMKHIWHWRFMDSPY